MRSSSSGQRRVWQRSSILSSVVPDRQKHRRLQCQLSPGSKSGGQLGLSCTSLTSSASSAPRHAMRSTYGFDPLGLGKDKASLERFQEAEVIHGRWAMLGVAGALGVEVLGFGNWYDAPTWVSRGNAHRARGGRTTDLGRFDDPGPGCTLQYHHTCKPRSSDTQ